MRSPTRTIVIIGGGFSGTVLAAQLLLRAPSATTRLVLVERCEHVGCGIAYRPRQYPYLLNVPAGRMSADSRDPGQFVRFAQQRCSNATAGDFLPRALYGEYLQAMLESARCAAPIHIRFERIQGQVHELERIDTDGPFLVTVSGRHRLLADDVVLACGDPPPASPAFALDIEGHDAYVCDPFCDGAFRADTQTLLLVGTGLTMVDAALTAAALNPRVSIHAVSRHGLLPAVQRDSPLQFVDTGLSEQLERGVISARRLLVAFRSLLGDVGRRGGDWRDAVMAARRDIPDLWRALPDAERRRFLRHLRARWDACRHRLPPASAARLAQLRDSGQFHVHAGHVQELRNDAGRLRVRWRARGSDHAATLVVDRVINCMGTDQRLRRTRDPLLRGLLDRGIASADRLGLGLRTGRHGVLVDCEGRAARHLFYLGPMLRSQYWEATAVGELRLYAEGLAQVLAQGETVS